MGQRPDDVCGGGPCHRPLWFSRKTWQDIKKYGCGKGCADFKTACGYVKGKLADAGTKGKVSKLLGGESAHGNSAVWKWAEGLTVEKLMKCAADQPTEVGVAAFIVADFVGGPLPNSWVDEEVYTVIVERAIQDAWVSITAHYEFVLAKGSGGAAGGGGAACSSIPGKAYTALSFKKPAEVARKCACSWKGNDTPAVDAPVAVCGKGERPDYCKVEGGKCVAKKGT